MSPATQATPLVAALGQLGPHDHFCSIYESPQEHYAVAIAFIRIGLDRGEKCIYIADDGTVGYVRQAMQSEGIDVDRATTSKALVLATKEQTYLELGSFNPDWMFTFWEKATQLAMSEGFSALRVTGETEWVLRGGRGLERWMEYESRLTHALSESNCCALCQYNRRLFPSELILDVIRTHPVVVYRGAVCRNLYYVPPDEFLGTNQTEREVERLLTNIREREQVEDALREQLTERKHAKDELRTQKEILQKIFDHTPMMIGMIGVDGQWQVINRAWERTFGWTLEELQQPNFNVLAEIYPDPREYQRVLDFITAKSGKWEEFKARVRDGRVLDVTFTNVYLSDGTTLGFGLDITERKRAEEGLRERASLLDLTHDTVFVRDMHDVISYWNRGAEELYGWSSEEAIGQVTHQLTQTIFPAPLEQINEELLRTGRWEGELIHTRRDGTRVVVASRWALQRDEHGNPIAILETNNNITERKQAEEELHRHREQLKELVAERTRQLSTLLKTSNTIASTLELQPLLRVVLEQLQAVVQYTGATILSLEGEDLVVLGHNGPLTPEQLAQVRLPAAQAPGFEAVRLCGGPLIVDDVWADSPEARAFRESPLSDRYPAFWYARCVLVVPLLVRERLIGIVGIESDQPHFYTERDAQLALAFANQAATAIENARLYDQARDLATIEERQRLARELHDAVTQTLFSASLIAEALPDAWRQSPAKALRGVEELRRLTRGALAEMRTLLLELRPAALAEKPLGELLEALCTSVTSRTRISIELDVTGDALLAPDIQIALYRVTQEALNNIAKHAAASQVTITFQCDPEQVELRITDDGRGFDPAALAPGSLGLGIMRERAASIGATLHVESRLEAGTEVRVDWQATPAARVHGGAG